MAETERLRDECPFPEVAEALRPFIRTRQEVANVRQRIQTSLPVSAINSLQDSTSIEHSSLVGVRKAYWRALEAHRKAQSRYDVLKAELDQMAEGVPSTTPNTEDSSSFLAESYVPLIRQREKHRKLEIIEKSLSRIEATGADAVGETFDKVAKREAGELPVPPSTGALPDREAGFNTDYDLTQLKKAVLLARQQVDQHQKATAQANGVAEDHIDPHADLKALQKAHNELTIWMEQQLALISDNNSPSETNGVEPNDTRTNGTASHNMSEIQNLYQQYLESRQRLLDTVANPPSPQLGPTPSPSATRRGSEALEADNRATISEVVLPYLSSLVSAKQQEQDFLQQTTYTRRQLASSEAQTQAVLARLADESHLVPPELSRGSPHGKDWAKAAETASKATEEAVAQRVRSGLASTEGASRALDSIKSMPASFDSLAK